MKIPYKYTWFWHRWLSKFILSAFCIETEIRGLERLPPPPYILVSNHYSNFDPMVYFAIYPYQIYFISKKEVFDMPFGMGKGIAAGGQISINRDNPGLGFIREAVGRLKQNDVIGIFPQGTRVVEGEKGEGKEGVGMLISMARVPVVTSYIENSGKLWGKGMTIPRAGKINVYIGETIPYEQLASLKGEEKRVDKKRYFKRITDFLIDKIYLIRDKFYQNVKEG